jgi:hypothetical protein
VYRRKGEGEGDEEGDTSPCTCIKDVSDAHDEDGGQGGGGGAVWGPEGGRGGESGLTHQGILGDSQSPKIKTNGGNELKGEP